VVAIMGSQSALAKAVGVSNNAVSKWVANGAVPPARVVTVYQLVAGKRTRYGECVFLEALLRESCERRDGIPCNDLPPSQ